MFSDHQITSLLVVVNSLYLKISETASIQHNGQHQSLTNITITSSCPTTELADVDEISLATYRVLMKHGYIEQGLNERSRFWNFSLENARWLRHVDVVSWYVFKANRPLFYEIKKRSYVLVLLEAFLAELHVSLAVNDLSEGFGCVLLVGDLSAEKVAGLRWVRERIGRVDLAGESLIERSHRVRIQSMDGSDRSPTSFLLGRFCARLCLKENRRSRFPRQKGERDRKWTGRNSGFNRQASADRGAPACNWILGVLLTQGWAVHWRCQ